MSKATARSKLILSIAFLGLFVLMAASGLKADETSQVTMMFNSGATFNGTVTYANGYSSVTGVNGTLTGYDYGSGYTGSGSDAISWIWYPGTNYSTSSTSATDFTTFLMDGTDTTNYSNFIQFSYDYSSGSPVLNGGGVGISLFGGGDVNNIDYTDAMISGSIATPEPSTIVMLLGGLGLLAIVSIRRRRAARQVPASA